MTPGFKLLTITVVAFVAGFGAATLRQQSAEEASKQEVAREGSERKPLEVAVDLAHLEWLQLEGRPLEIYARIEHLKVDALRELIARLDHPDHAGQDRHRYPIGSSRTHVRT